MRNDKCQIHSVVHSFREWSNTTYMHVDMHLCTHWYPTYTSTHPHLCFASTQSLSYMKQFPFVIFYFSYLQLWSFLKPVFLYCIASHWIVLYCTVLRCIILYWVVLHCIVLCLVLQIMVCCSRKRLSSIYLSVPKRPRRQRTVRTAITAPRQSDEQQPLLSWFSDIIFVTYELNIMLCTQWFRRFGFLPSDFYVCLLFWRGDKGKGGGGGGGGWRDGRGGGEGVGERERECVCTSLQVYLCVYVCALFW